MYKVGFFIGLMCWSVLAAAQTLTVSAASSLSNAMREVAQLYQAAHPGVQVRINTGGSGSLLQQIRAGAPVDVLATADQTTMDQAQQAGLLRADSRADFVSNTLVLIVPQGAAKPASLQDLPGPDYVRMAMGNPDSVPVGRYTKAVLEHQGLWTRLQPKMIYTVNARQALDYVARKEVQAGFVYATDARLMPAQVQLAMALPTPYAVSYPIAVTRSTSQPAAALSFVQFIRGSQAQAVFEKHGFAPAP
jgi:molybdate transport system substrate-binding protein